MEEGKREYIEEWTSSNVEKKLKKKRERVRVTEETPSESDKPEIILNNTAEMTKEERRKCISYSLHS